MHGVDDALEDTTNPVLDVPEEDNAESKLIWFGETRGNYRYLQAPLRNITRN